MGQESRAFIIDIEASGLMRGSYPIEIALHEIGGDGRACWLIKPEPGWSKRYWDEEAELIHGITRREAKERGLPAREVCRELRAALGDGRLYSDAHLIDQVWLDRLQEAEWPPCEPLTIAPISTFVPPARRDEFIEASEALERPHRAAPDAQVIAGVALRFCWGW